MPFIGRPAIISIGRVCGSASAFSCASGPTRTMRSSRITPQTMLTPLIQAPPGRRPTREPAGPPGAGVSYPQVLPAPAAVALLSSGQRRRIVVASAGRQPELLPGQIAERRDLGKMVSHGQQVRGQETPVA